MSRPPVEVADLIRNAGAAFKIKMGSGYSISLE
jgi:hypothetical protein